MKPHYLTPFFAPQSIAIVGASDHPHSVGGQVLSNLKASGFRGTLYPVHLVNEQVQGLTAYPTLEAIGQPVDLVMLATPAAGIPDLIDQCGALGYRAVIVLSTGFSEAGLKGAQLEADMLARGRRHGVRILGPNCLGVMRPAIGLSPPFVKAGGVALVSQSTALSSGILDWASGNEIGLSTVVSVGNSADIDFAEIVDFLVSDIQTLSILVFLERVENSRTFLSALREAARVKPVIVLKADRRGGQLTQEEISAAHADQGDAIFDAALRRAGVVRVRTLTQLFSAARACAVRFRKSGPRLAIISNGEGPGALAADQALDDRIPLAQLSANTISELNTIMPAGWQGINPLDVGNGAGADTYHKVAAAVLSDPAVDSLLVMLTPQIYAQPTATAEAMVELTKVTQKPLMGCWMGDRHVVQGRITMSAAQLPNFRTPESAVDAISYVSVYHRNQQMLFQTPPPVTYEKPPQLIAAKEVIAPALKSGQLQLGDRDIEKLFSTFHIPYRAGVPLPPILGRQLERRVIKMGMVRDQALGPCLFIGPAGIAAELPKAIAYALPPLNAFLANELIERSTIAPLLAQRGDVRAIDHDALVAVLLRLSEMACEMPEVADVQMVVLLTPTEPVEITEAHLTLTNAPLPKTRYGHMAVHPYPADLVKTVTLPNGTEVTLRPIRPEDAEMEQNFVRALSEDSRYYRFMDVLRELPKAMLARFTQLDYQREMAIVAITGHGEEEKQIGVARYNSNPDGESCEFALVIADDWQGQHLGKTMMGYLMQIAKNRGLKIMEGEVLAANSNMLRLMGSLGFTSKTAAEDPAVREVTAIL